MATLRDAVRDYQDELRAGIAWVAFWREGRSWNSDYIYLETDDTLTPEDRGRLQEIQAKDPAAVVLNGYYCGYLGEDMNLSELTAGVRRHYENSYNNIADFIEANDDRLPPEVIGETREAAHAAGLPFSEKPYRDGDFDPYVFDGSMSIDDYDLMHRMMNEERSKRMSETFSILIDSRSRFETGKPGGVWLPMPTTTEQLHEAMRSVGITADNPQDFFINGFANTEEYPFDVPLSVIQQSTIDELNYLGSLLVMQGDEDRDKFTAAVTLGEHAGSVKDLINLAQNLDCYWIYPTVQSEADYGYYLIDELDELELPEEAKKYFKYEEYGHDAVQKDRGQFTEQGYIYNNGNTFSQWYNGRENDIPQEYKAMSFPEPERPAPEKSDFEAAAAPAFEPRPVEPIILAANNSADKMKEITDRLEHGIMGVFESGKYTDYLQTLSKFHNYSFNNTMLIAMQGGTFVKGFQQWKKEFDRHVKPNEKSIKIIAPSPYKIRREVEKKDPQTGQTVIGGDGKPVTETKEFQIPAFKVVSVFDVSQTEGKEIPGITDNELTGDVEQYRDFFTALERTSPFAMGFEALGGTVKGRCFYDEQRIAINEGMSELQNIKTAIHEIAHATLHSLDRDAPDRPDRSTREVQAESVAYTVCQHYGLDTSDYSFNYIATWSSGRELAELKNSLATIRATAAELINTIDGHLAEIRKEREAEQEQEAQTPPDLTAEPTVTILYSESSQLHEGETFPLSRANTIIAGLDEANLASPGYDKTEFRIDFVMDGEADHYEGRQDLGDGDGSLVEHIEQYHTYYANDPNWNNFLLEHEGKEALEADKEHRAFLLNEFVPYLKLHCNLSEMERTAGEALQKDNLTPTETAYHTAIQSYVSECRGLINQGEYHLPPVPQLADFDVELQAYKEHVKEEIAQEAADAGMTVEEYAANGYEPYAAPEPEYIYKMEANPMTDGIYDRFFLQAYKKGNDGKAIPRDVLFMGTPEQCRELLGKLETGELSQEQVKELFAQAQEAAKTAEQQPEKPEAQEPPQEPEKADTTAQQEAAADKAATPEQAGQTADKPLTDLQKKAVEIAAQYENLPMRDKIGIIAQAFGGTEGKIETSPCTGKWRGTSDISIKFDNGVSLFIGNQRTPQAKTAKVQSEYVNSALVRYNPEIIAATKEAAIAALRKREAKDNEIAAQKGLKPYTLLNVEFNDGTDERSSGHLGWYYVTLAVDGKICSHIETGLHYDILDGKVSDTPARENYFPAGALKETDVDYVFNNVGFSSTSDLYSLPVRDDVLERAEKTLAQRKEAQPEKTTEPQTHTAEQPETTVTYYPINENAARRAKEAISFSDYKPGSATAEYRHYVDEAAELAARQKKRVDPSFHAKIDGLLDAYARKLAANMNKGNEITARVPSIMIAGGSNFPVRKKEKQNAAADKNMQEFNEIQGLLDKIRSTGMGGISADDPNAVSKLESKLAKLEQAQETMKAVNAYYRKHKTLDGCPHLSAEQIEKLKEAMSGSYRANPKPFESYQLSNNNAEIHRLKDRITALTRRKELGYVGWEFDGGRVEANTTDNRLQIFFDEKPDKEIREELKGNGFRYAPSAEAWQRQLNDNAIYAADRLGCIQPLTGESPTELQKRTRQEAAALKTADPEQAQQGAAQEAEPGDAATPETFYKVRQNPYSDSRENSHILQEYIAQDNGMAKLGDILYMGTPEKCRELLGKLEAGELTQGDVKELYAKAQEAQHTEPGQETPEPAEPGKEPDNDTFTIYQLKRGDETRDYRFEPYDHLQAAGLCVDPANYDLIYTAPLTPDMTLEDISIRFNVDHPADFRGHSLSTSDIVVLHQNGQDTAHYADRYGYREVPEFLQEQTPQLTPDSRMTGEQIRTPRGSFSVTDMTAEQMKEAGYGLHHTSEDGKYLIMGNGTQAFAVAAEQPEKENPLKHVEDAIEQNDNNFDGIINNTPTADELEAKARSGEQISLAEYAAALKAEKEQGKDKKPGKKTEKKPSIRAQLKADKERTAQRKQARSKSQDLERS